MPDKVAADHVSVWERVRGAVAAIAPTLGAAMGGPAGGLLGAAVAGALGVGNDPNEIEQALRIDPNAAIKLRELESNEKVSLATLAKEQYVSDNTTEAAELETVNATIREESKSEKWYVAGWRPFWGFVSGAAFGAVALFTCMLAYRAIVEGDAAAMTMIPQFVTSMAVLFGIPGTILGIASWHRGAMQRGV